MYEVVLLSVKREDRMQERKESGAVAETQHSSLGWHE